MPWRGASHPSTASCNESSLGSILRRSFGAASNISSRIDNHEPHHRATDPEPTQREAETRAKAQVSDAGEGHVHVHRPGGRIRDADTVYPGNEPSGRDTKH
ncbi:MULTISPECIES: DUF2188 domain-containing protein [Microbacterium]|uniref:DUF2188 domain-containing protein n=1 Tax=Microbacterium TaxID=33882 RepID=UPI00169A54F8|nr:DUF2188 domain-containing protein [Microbacterium sp. Be9]